MSVPSSVIHGMVYWPHLQAVDIVFRGTRGAYRYFDVSPSDWRAFKRSPSKGTHLNITFKARHPRYQRLKAIPSEFTTALSAATAPIPRDLPNENIWGFYENSL